MVKVFNYINLDIKKVDFEGKQVVIYGRGVEALRVYMSLKGQHANVLGFVDSFSKDDEKFAGCKVFSLLSLSDINDLIIYVAVANEAVKREILYLLEEKRPGNAIVVARGVVYGAWDYDILSMKEIIDKDSDEIQYVADHLSDSQSVTVFNKLVEYRRTNDRKLVEECYETKHKQYFTDVDILKHVCDEIFLDVGGFDGLTTVDFVEWTHGDYQKVIIFEADEVMFNVCSEMMRIKNINKVEIYRKAAFSESAIIAFDNTDYLSGSGSVNAAGNVKVEAVSIDDFIGDGKVTFIKMDIEGAEMEALKGAEKTIEREKPKLAISIYHKDDDLWKIPYYLMKKYPFYKYYIRHYTPYTTETIIYATT